MAHRTGFFTTATLVPGILSIMLIGALFYWWDVIRIYDAPLILFLLLATLILLGGYTLRLHMLRRVRTVALGNTTIDGLDEQLYEELFENSPVPYMLIDGVGKVVMPNVAAVRIFGRSESELRGTNVFSLLDAEDETHLTLIPEKLEKGIYVTDEEVEIDRPDGTCRFVRLSAFPFNDTKRKRYNLITFIDITKQKEVDQVKTEFVSLASHQLRTPISSLKWNTELLRSERIGTLNEKQTKYAAKIEQAAERMDALVADFLNVSKLELGTLVPNATQIEIDTFLESVYEEFQERIEKNDIMLQKEYAEDITTIVADQRLLRMVLTNLISNAVKYTPAGGTVTVKYSGNDDWVTFSIADTGMGIPAEDQEQLFTKLFRAHNAREQVPEGTGLGLYVVKQAVEVLEGEISFTSEENTGTTFKVVLPR